jgi:hypothetical protein
VVVNGGSVSPPERPFQYARALRDVPWIYNICRSETDAFSQAPDGERQRRIF